MIKEVYIEIVNIHCKIVNKFPLGFPWEGGLGFSRVPRIGVPFSRVWLGIGGVSVVVFTMESSIQSLDENIIIPKLTNSKIATKKLDLSTTVNTNDTDTLTKTLNSSSHIEGAEGQPEAEGEEAVEWVAEGEEEEDARIELGLVGKVWTKRAINAKAFMSTMQQVWQPMHGVDISSIGENTFIFQFHHWRDKSKVMEGQPWHFDNHAIIFDHIQGNFKPSELNLYELPMWVRVYNLPFKGRLNLANVEAIGKKIGVFVKMDNSGSFGIDKSIRLRIKVDVRKPLLQRVKVKLRGGEEDYYEVKYERPPLFCYHCGRLGHGIKDCEECREEDEPTLNFGMWMKASPWKRNLGRNYGQERPAMQGCAKSLFVTKPKPDNTREVCSQVRQVAHILSEALTLEGEKDRQEVEETNIEEEGGKEGVEGIAAEILSSSPSKIIHTEKEESIKVPQTSRKKGWKRAAREGKVEGKMQVNVGGLRRKERNGEKEEEECEGITCGIRKKIGLDASVVMQQSDAANLDGVAGPTSWTLGEE